MYPLYTLFLFGSSSSFLEGPRIFLVTNKRLYKGVCPSVRRSVGNAYAFLANRSDFGRVYALIFPQARQRIVAFFQPLLSPSDFFFKFSFYKKLSIFLTNYLDNVLTLCGIYLDIHYSILVIIASTINSSITS